MNKPIRRVALVALAMFAALLVNASYTFVFRHNALASSDYNRRVRNEQFAQDRGPIMVGNTAIADTKPTTDPLKFQRVYPDGPTYAAITGWYSYDYAQSGLERSFNKDLAGTSDSLAVQRTMDKLTGKPAKGATLETTIDPTIQAAAIKALGDAKGAIVALDPKTGAVKALVSTPTYDPNQLATHDLAAARKAWQSLNGDPDRPLANRATREIYPPGSTFKLVVAAAALENGMDPSTMVEAPDSITLPGTNSKLPNQGHCGNTKITFEKALMHSCNTSFALIGMNLGEQKLAEQAQKFGFGARHLAELSGVASKFPTGMNKAELALSSIGQFDVAASPLQMAMVGAAIANDGIVMEPYLVQTVRGPNLQVVSSHKPKEIGRAMSAENAKKLRGMMISVVKGGSGKRAAIPGVNVAGKTGTAQHKPGQPPYGAFVAIAPGDNPSIVVYVFVEKSDANPTDATYAGAFIAAPMAKQVLEAALR